MRSHGWPVTVLPIAESRLRALRGAWAYGDTKAAGASAVQPHGTLDGHEDIDGDAMEEEEMRQHGRDRVYPGLQVVGRSNAVRPAVCC